MNLKLDLSLSGNVVLNIYEIKLGDTGYYISHYYNMLYSKRPNPCI